MSYPNLRAEMARRGITNRDIAKRVGVCPQTVGSWLNGSTNMPLYAAVHIRQMLGDSSIDYLFSQDVDSETVTA